MPFVDNEIRIRITLLDGVGRTLTAPMARLVPIDAATVGTATQLLIRVITLTADECRHVSKIVFGGRKFEVLSIGDPDPAFNDHRVLACKETEASIASRV